MIIQNQSPVQPDPSRLIKKIGLTIPLIGFYDAPDPHPFEPLVIPGKSGHNCIFAFYKQWLKGLTLHLTREHYGCGGAGHWICGLEGRSREDFLDFLVNTEGLKSSFELMDKWLDYTKPYQQENDNIMIGPLKKDQYAFLKTITFWVNPDQLSALMIGAEYHANPDDFPSVIAPFGSGCMQMAVLLTDHYIPQALIGATDIAARKYIPQELLAFTLTRPMFENLCKLNERSFLYKSFWRELKKIRKS